jgi:nicotinamidase-related amidase
VKHVWGENPEASMFDIREEIKPLENEPVVIKRTPGSFFNTNLEELLKNREIENVIITGMMTNHCCDTTTREASARGYKTMVINDCVRTFDLKGIDGKLIPRETIQYVTLSILQGFAKIVSLDDLDIPSL